MTNGSMQSPRALFAWCVALAVGALACDARPPQGAVDIAPDTLGLEQAGDTLAGAPPATSDSLAAVEVVTPAQAAIPDSPIVPGRAVGPEDFHVGVTPVDPSQRVRRPEHVRALYVNGWSAGSRARMAALIGIADRTEINTFVIDIKEADGQVTYSSTIPIVRRVGANLVTPINDVRGLLARLREHGIYPIARIVVFKDPVLASARPDWAVQTADQRLWRDHHGEIWVDSYNRNVWEYNLALAREAVALGFSEVQWDYVRFPDVPRAYMRTAVHPARAGRSRPEAIREFLSYTREQLDPTGVPVTADVFGVTTSAETDVGIGQYWESMADVTDVLLPMVYPSHYPRGSFDIRHPNADPYRTVLTALRHAVQRNRRIENAATIRPWLQDFTLGQPVYRAAHVRAQIRATYDAGLTEWVLWNASSRYTTAALADADGNVPHIEGLAALIGPADSVTAAAEGAAADSALVSDSVAPPAKPSDEDQPLGTPKLEAVPDRGTP